MLRTLDEATARPANPHTDLPRVPGEMARRAGPFDLAALDPMLAPAIRWGIIGAGGIARTFAHDVPAYTQSTVTAIGARDLGRAQAFADEFGIAIAYGSYEELVASPHIDAVYVATPHTFHRDQALLALRAGKPVLVEKAFTVNAAQAREVLDEAAAQDLPAMEAMWSRHLPHYRLIRAIIDAGDLGTVSQVHADHGQSLLHVERLVDPELAGGALLDLGVYPVHFAHWIAGAPDTATATGRLHESGVDLAEAVAVRWESGTSGTLTAAMDGRSATYGDVVLTHGALEMPLQFYRPGVLRMRTFPDDGPEDGLTVDWDATVPGGFQYQAAEFARMVDEGRRESPIVPWQATLDVMELMDGIRDGIGLRYPFE